MSLEKPHFGEIFEWGFLDKPERKIMFIGQVGSAWTGIIIADNEPSDGLPAYGAGEIRRWAPLDRRAKRFLNGWTEVPE